MAVIATAGHVDHGKSSLVLALTGTDPDRLAEEKRKGMTIDLGFAHFLQRYLLLNVNLQQLDFGIDLASIGLIHNHNFPWNLNNSQIN